MTVKIISFIFMGLFLALLLVTSVSAQRKEEDRCFKISEAWFSTDVLGANDNSPWITVSTVNPYDDSGKYEFRASWSRFTIYIRPDTINHHACLYLVDSAGGRSPAIFLSEKAFPLWRAALSAAKDIENLQSGWLKTHHKGLVPLLGTWFSYFFYDIRYVEFRD